MHPCYKVADRVEHDVIDVEEAEDFKYMTIRRVDIFKSTWFFARDGKGIHSFHSL
jgi:hypothetical protein